MTASSASRQLTSSLGPPGRQHTWRRLRRHLVGWAFISPWVFGFLGLTLYPFFMSIFYSFTFYQLGRPPQFIGFENFHTMFVLEPKFWISLGVTFRYTFVVVPLTVVQGVLVAILLNQDVKGIPFFRTAFYIPGMVSGVGWILLWILILGKGGALNSALALLGIEGPSYLIEQAWALRALMLMTLFTVGSSMLITLAALQGVPKEQYEAVEIDGGNFWDKFWHVTIPQISPAIFYNLVMGIIGTFQTWQQGFLMTEGGPRNATLFYGLYLYYNAFQYNKMGYACALAWVMFVIILAFTGLNFLGAKFWVYYEGGSAA
ncbi:MAG: sugar ABC transporter permease [Chloroflexi bacterium]|nr:sugar ABC transporter permease [Chloroflexota bacterium]